MRENSGDSAKVGREKALPNVNDRAPRATASRHRHGANARFIHLFVKDFRRTRGRASTHPAMRRER
jgi:hypothetical protein